MKIARSTEIITKRVRRYKGDIQNTYECIDNTKKRPGYQLRRGHSRRYHDGTLTIISGTDNTKKTQRIPRGHSKRCHSNIKTHKWYRQHKKDTKDTKVSIKRIPFEYYNS